MKHLVSRELVASAVMTAIGAAFLYYAAFGENRNLAWSVYWNLGCALGFFGTAVQPQALFEKVERQGLKVQLPKARGVASLLNMVSTACIVTAALIWLLT